MAAREPLALPRCSRAFSLLWKALPKVNTRGNTTAIDIKVKSKLKDGVKALMCTRLTLNFRAKMLLYNGAFKSHIEYCSLVFMDKLNKKQINELYKLQKQAVRLKNDVNPKRNLEFCFDLVLQYF